MKLFTSLLHWLDNFFTADPFLGVLPDTRSEEEKEFDPLHEEVAMGFPIVSWQVKLPESWKHYTLRNQNLESFDCVAFSTTTGVEADQKLDYSLSARDIYDQRSNYPAPGMIPFEGVSLIANHGALPNALHPSDNLTEEELNTIFIRSQEENILAQKLSGGIPVQIKNIDIDTIASLISEGMSVRLCFHFTLKEWTAIPQLYNDGQIHHQVVGIDYSIVNGKKCIIIQDSCFPNTTYVFPHGLRAITEDFLVDRCYAATYIKKPIVVETPQIPQHTFTVDMQYGDSGSEVMLLQTKLQALGFFPVTPTGYFGGISKQAVVAFQKAKGIVPALGYVGPLTRASLNT